MTSRIESVLAWFVGILFSLAAGFMVWFLGSTYYHHYEARTWAAVPATVLKFELHTSRSRSGTSSLPTIQEQLVTSYTYTFNNTAYSGSRVDFGFGSDNFSQERHRGQMALLRSKDITVYIDPSVPQEIFAIVFLLFPCGIGTAVSLGLLSAGLAKLGISPAERYFMPFLGIFHSAPALYPILFDPASIGAWGWVILTCFLALLVVSIRSGWKRFKDPSLGKPQWPDRFKQRYRS
jgi:hypothetical protein